MQWSKLLTRFRLGKTEDESEINSTRTAFQRDFDRVVFSSAFRRLQDKTQVHPLARSDYVRTRLTHSLETASVGRSLGTITGIQLLKRHPELKEAGYEEADFGAIVAAASLAHDIGNPPFGHAGEDAIQEWFEYSETGREILALIHQQYHADFLRFEGNAQGLRNLCYLANTEQTGGLRLTCATLGTFMKYPRHAAAAGTEPGRVSAKKHGYFQAERSLVKEIAKHCGLIESVDGVWRRHPLALLMEAADDICYRIVDIEDGYRNGILNQEESCKVLRAVAQLPEAEETRYQSLKRPEKKIEMLRAKSIDHVVRASIEVFMDKEADILAGVFDQSLIDLTPLADALNACQELTRERIYPARGQSGIQKAGYTVIEAQLECLAGAVLAHWRHETTGSKLRGSHQAALKLLPEQFLTSGELYTRILGVTDFIAGMTDRYAVDLYRRITGMALGG